jgi:protein-disulfide isomerase
MTFHHHSRKESSMKRTATWLAAIVVGLTNLPALAQTRDDKRKPDAPSLQQQIDELKAGQQQILKEVQEIKKILQSFQEAANQQTPQEISLPVGGEPFKGSPAARLAIIEYSDYQCPFCGEYARDVFPHLDSDYVKSGKVRYYFRDLPLPAHPQALLAALASRCAGEQGKFWEMHERLFANQNALGADALKQHAASLGLDMTRFNDCLAAGKYRTPVARSMASAERLRIDGTPAFLIGVVDANGETVRVSQVLLGAKDYQEFKAVLDSALAAPSK